MDTTKTITHISLCAGYGGIDIGLKRCLPTLRTILVSEIEAYAVANLVAKMEAGEMDPAPIWTDLKTLPLECIPKGTDILSGGFPCQPFSQAGNREGDEDPRHLFPYIKNAIRTIQPRLVFLENVEGIISAKLKGDGWEDPAGTPVLLHVLRELERVGYECAWGVFSAAEVGAPHQRKRVFVLASRQNEAPPGAADGSLTGPLGEIGDRAQFELANAGSKGCEGVERKGKAGEERSPHRHAAECGGSVADPNSSRGFKDWIASQLRASGVEQSPCNRWPSRPGEAQQEWEEPRVVGNAHSNESAPERGDNGEVPEVSTEQGQEQCASISGGTSPAELADTDPDRLQGCSLSDEQGQEDHKANGKSQRQTQPIVGGATDGLAGGLDPTANRVDRLRLLGNGVVPDTCEVAFRTLYKELCEKD